MTSNVAGVDHSRVGTATASGTVYADADGGGTVVSNDGVSE